MVFVENSSMTLRTIKVPANAKTRIAEFVKELGGEVVSNKSKAAKKEALLNEIKQGLNDVKLIRQGKIKPFSMSDLVS